MNTLLESRGLVFPVRAISILSSRLEVDYGLRPNTEPSVVSDAASMPIFPVVCIIEGQLRTFSGSLISVLTYWTGKRVRRRSGSLKTTPKWGETCKCKNVLNNTNHYFGAWVLASDSMKIGFLVSST
jgi:hypothetical protein